MNREDLRRRAKELENEATKAMSDMESGEITPARAREIVDKALEESATVKQTIDTYRKAAEFAGAADLPAPQQSVELEIPEGPDGERPMTHKQFGEAYEQLKHAARNRIPNSTITFDFAVKGGGFPQLGLKTQGETGLQGEAASGTSTPAALGSNYFLPGPGGPAILPQFIPGILELRWYQNVIADLFPTFPTDSPVVSYVRETGWTNNAAATYEGQTFPTSTNAIQRYTEQVGKVTNLIRTTDEQVQDNQYYLALIEKRCVMGVTRKEEVELLAGAGWPGVNGILNRTTGFTAPQTISAVTNLAVPTAGTAGLGAAGDTVSSVTPGRAIVGTGSGVAPDGAQIAIGILAALTDIRTLHFFEPTAVVLNPADWFTVRTWQDANGQFMAGGPWFTDYGQTQNNVNPQVQATDSALNMWGMRIVTTPAMPEGYILVGDFPDGGQVLRRGGLRTEMVNTNASDFEQGLWTMRSYTRVGLVIERPELFELIQLQNGS